MGNGNGKVLGSSEIVKRFMQSVCNMLMCQFVRRKFAGDDFFIKYEIEYLSSLFH